MDKAENTTKCQALLQDNSFYQHLSKDTSPTIHKELVKILQDYKDNNFISQTEYTQLRPHGSNSPASRFYGLPKINKNNIQMHPIISATHNIVLNSSGKFFRITVERLHALLKIVQISSRKFSISQ